MSRSEYNTSVFILSTKEKTKMNNIAIDRRIEQTHDSTVSKEKKVSFFQRLHALLQDYEKQYEDIEIDTAYMKLQEPLDKLSHL